MTEQATLRHALLTRTLFETLRDAEGPLPARDALRAVRERLELTQHELSLNNSGIARFETYLRWVSSWASAIGWMAKRGGWTITEAGIEALTELAGDELDTQLGRRYRQLRKTRKGTQTRYRDPRWSKVLSALGYVEPGWWTTYGDLAQVTGIAAQAVGQFLAKEPIDIAYRVLRADGTVSPDFRWSDPNRTDDPRSVLAREGIEFDPAGRASPGQRITADDFRERFAELADDPDSVVRRAWLVRGSSVDGRDLVMVWIPNGWTSLPASRLRTIVPPIPRDELRAVVDEDYQHISYGAREAKFAEFEAFCNRMRVGDLVLTTTQGKAYVGRITGAATYTQSDDQRSNLRREIQWLNATQPVPFNRLPNPLPAKLHSQSDVVELTEDIDAIERLLADLGIEATAKEPERALAFPPVTAELADDLLIDEEWLRRQADLLWERKQMIFYGPPGTGKTYIARKLAAHLAEPSAVKLVQFHPSYTYEDFFEGFRPVPREDGQLAFDLRRGPFRQLVDAARDHPSDPYLLIIDEINRANLAKVFGELYFLLEYRDDAISLLYSTDSDKSDFTLPPNVFVIGTMNTTDRSIALVDAAMRRRFAFVELHPDTPPTSGVLTAWLRRLAATETLAHNLDGPDLLAALNSRIEARDLAIGPSYLMRPDIYRRADGLAVVWETSILPLLAEHHYGSPPEVLDQYRLGTLREALAAKPSGDGLP